MRSNDGQVQLLSFEDIAGNALEVRDCHLVDIFEPLFERADATDFEKRGEGVLRDLVAGFKRERSRTLQIGFCFRELSYRNLFCFDLAKFLKNRLHRFLELAVLDASLLSQAEVDIAAAPGAAVSDPMLAVGRTLGRSVAAGATLRQSDLKARQYFAAGETVRVTALGPGWSVVTEGQAIGAGIEGQPVHVRTEGGRLLTARPSGDRQVEVTL